MGKKAFVLEEQENGLKEYTNDSHGGRQTSTIFVTILAWGNRFSLREELYVRYSFARLVAGRIEQENIQSYLLK